MRAHWVKDQKLISGRLELEEKSLIFKTGEWPFTKIVWEKPYELIKRIGHADALLHFVGPGMADYEFKVHLLDGSFEIFRLLGPGYAFAWDFIHTLRARVKVVMSVKSK